MFLIALLSLIVGEPLPVPPGKIAFMREGKVWIIDADGTNVRSLTAELRFKADRPLAWSPKGSKLLFYSHSVEEWDIWVMDADGKNQKNLTNTRSGGCRSPNWSPDGKRIAFMRDHPQGLYVMDADGKDQKRLSEKGHRDDKPAWSPDGKQIAFTDSERGLDIYVVDADGRNEFRIVQGGKDPVWSPEGKKLLFVGPRRDSYCLCQVDPDGKNEIILTKGLSTASAPLWSPDGSRIAYVSSEESKTQLRVMDANGKNDRQLADRGPEEWGSHSWSPDGHWIAFTSGARGKESTYVVDIRGHNLSKLADGVTLYPVWQPAR